MGQRANLITIENGEYTLRYDHWCANRLDDILFWGVKYALDYFDAQDEVGEDGWLDEIWAEGGAVLDLDKKHLLWWGGEDVLYDLPLRRVYLKLQRQVWNGWEIKWAHRGIVDLAEYVGYSKEKVLSNGENLNEAVVLKNAVENFDWIETIGSIKLANGETKLFGLNAIAENYLHNGINLIDQCKSEKGLEKIVWSDWKNDEDFPQSGFWIDEQNKIIEFWQVRDCPNVVQNLKEIWDEWEIVWHRDKYEFQLERLKDKLVLPKIDEAKLIEKLRDNLLREYKKSGLESALDTNETLRNSGLKVEINPWLFKSHHVEQPLESKLQIWQRNFGE